MSARKKLAIYLMAGEETAQLAVAAVAGGADLIEIGFPYSNPLAEGPLENRRRPRKAYAHAEYRKDPAQVCRIRPSGSLLRTDGGAREA